MLGFSELNDAELCETNGGFVISSTVGTIIAVALASGLAGWGIGSIIGSLVK